MLALTVLDLQKANPQVDLPQINMLTLHTIYTENNCKILTAVDKHC